MKVGPAKAKRTYPGPSGMLSTYPRSGFRVQVKWRLFNPQFGIGLRDIDGGRQDLVVQGERGFNQAGGARGGFRMPNLGFDAPQSDLLLGRIVFGKDFL